MRIITLLLAAGFSAPAHSQDFELSSKVTWNSIDFESAAEVAWPNLTYDIFKDIDGNLWKVVRSERRERPFDDGSSEGRFYVDNASELCSFVKLGGLWEFRLPTVSELKKIQARSSFAPKNGTYWSNEITYSDGERKVKTYNFEGSRESKLKPSFKAYSICVTSHHQNMDVYALADTIVDFKRSSIDKKTTATTLPKPVFTQKKQVPNSEKGEFETTEMFNSRILDLTKKANEKYQQDRRNYEDELNKWEIQKRRHVENVKSQSSNFEGQLYNEKLKSLGIAMNLIYGRPVIESAVYNADKSEFTIKISSTNGKYLETVNIPVELNHAPKFKEILLEENFSPTLLFSYQNSQLSFLRIKELQSPEQLVEQNELQLASDSIENLRKFIAKYPNSTYKSEANLRISAIQAAEEKRLIEEKIQAEERALKKLARDKKAKELAEQKAIQDAYDYEHACENYYVGYVGEWERTGWLATGEKFVVRYTNQDRRSVTIEATESGNSLSYGENKELSCFDLLQGERRALSR